MVDTLKRSTFALCSEQDNVARMELELPVTVNLFYGPTPHEALGDFDAAHRTPARPPGLRLRPLERRHLRLGERPRVAAALRDAGAPSSVDLDRRTGSAAP